MPTDYIEVEMKTSGRIFVEPTMPFYLSIQDAIELRNQLTSQIDAAQEQHHVKHPAITIEVEVMNTVFTKYHIRGLPFDAVIHHFTGLDDTDPHDHPYSFRSFILKGGYIERVWGTGHMKLEEGAYLDLLREPGATFRVDASRIHQIISFPEGECWTLILPGPSEKKSGFYQFKGNEVFHRFWDEPEFKKLF